MRVIDSPGDDMQAAPVPAEARSLPDNRLWNIKETAYYLNLSVGTLYNYVSRGDIPHVKLSNGAVRFRKTHIDRWLKRRECPPRSKSTPAHESKAS